MSQSPAYAADGFRGATANRKRTPALPGQGAIRCAIVLLCLGTSLARADGGHIALRAASGPYRITLFTAPEPLVSGPVDLSLLVEDAASGEVMEEVTAAGSLTPADGATIPFVLTRAAASDKLLLAATPTLPAPGLYVLVLHVEHPGAQPAGFTVRLAVGADHRRRTTLIFALAIPFGAILLFLINQQAKLRRRAGPPALH